MLQILNKTPFSSGIGLFTAADGTEWVAAVVKATFTLPAGDATATLSKEQLPIREYDSYFGEPGQSSVQYPADLMLNKPATDIGVIGAVHSPAERPVTQLVASIAVGAVRKQIFVIGDRQWGKRTLLPGMVMSSPKSFVTLPLRYELSFGGYDRTASESASSWDARNPIGRGYLLTERAVDGSSLPNFEDPEQPISSWRDRPPVSGLGFIDRSWYPRMKFAGTYDSIWRQHRFPLLPDDFDNRFFNCAANGLTAPGYLKGDELVELVHLSCHGLIRFRLPSLQIRMRFQFGGQLYDRPTALFSLVFEPEAERFYMVWGSSFPVGKQPSLLRYVKIEREHGLLVCS